MKSASKTPARKGESTPAFAWIGAAALMLAMPSPAPPGEIALIAT